MNLHKHELRELPPKTPRKKRAVGAQEGDNRLLNAFLEERCAPSTLGFTSVRVLYVAFCAWCRELEHPTPLSLSLFNKQLQSMSEVAKAPGTGLGLRLRTRAERGLPPLLIGLYGRPMPPWEASAWEEVVRLWWERWGTATVSNKELLNQLGEAIPLPAGCFGLRLSHLGCVLRALSGQRVGSWVIDALAQQEPTRTFWSYALRAAAPLHVVALPAA